ETRRHPGTDTRVQTVPGGEISRVAALELRKRKDLARFDREVLARLAGQLEPPEPRIALVEREARFGEERIRRILPGLLIAAPSDRARPDAALTKDAMVGRGRGHTIDVHSCTGVVTGFSFSQVATSDLQRPSIRWEDPPAARPRIERADVEVGAILVRFAPVEDRRLGFPPLAVHAAGDHAVRNVGRVEPVMR